LNISKERTNDCQLKLVVEVEQARVEQYLRRAGRRLAEKVNIPGFRKGKAPYDVVVRVLGKGAVYEEALDELVPEVFSEALKQEGIEPYAQAHLDNVSLEPMVLTFLVPLSPEIDLKDYRNIRVETEEITVSEEDIDKVLEQLRQENAGWQPVNRPVMAGDMAVVHLKVAIGSESLDDDDRAFVVEPEQVMPIPGFMAALVGMEAGQTKSFELTYPADWEKEALRGQTAQIEVTLKEVQEKVLPELNDEFALLVGDYDSLSDLREAIRRKLAQEAENMMARKVQNQALKELVERSEITFPLVLVEEQLDRMARDHDTIIRSHEGMSLEDYLKMNGQDMDWWRAHLMPQAEEQVKQSLALDKLAELERLTVTDEEREQEEQRLLDLFRDDPETIQQFLVTPQGQDLVTRQVISRKAMDRLVEIATGKAPELEEPQSGGQATQSSLETGESLTPPADNPSTTEVVEVADGESV